MTWAYAHVLLVLGVTAAIVIMVAAVSARFGTVVPSQRACVMLAGFTSIVAVVSSAYFFSETWRETVSALQLATLPTLLSGVAAVGVVLQWYQVPYVYTTIDPRLSRRVLGLVLPAKQRSRLELHVYNCSNVTAHDIIVQGMLPPQVRLESIEAPIFWTVDAQTNRFEVHFDSDRSYNPLHPHVHSTLRLNVAVGELPGPHAVIVHTMAKNMRTISHTFVLGTLDEHVRGKNLGALVKKARLPLAQGPERLMAALKIATVLQLMLAGAPWMALVHAWVVSARP